MADNSDLAARVASLEADNARLRRLLDAAGMPDALRHGLRNTLAVVREVIRQSAETASDVESYAAHLEGRFDAIAQVRTITDTFGEADLQTIFADALLRYVVHEGGRATISGAQILLKPKAAQVLALAAHELVCNGVEHGALGLLQGQVTISWTVGSEAVPIVTLSWKETGEIHEPEPPRRGFGTLVLEEMLTYELEANVVLAHEPDGLCCTVRFPLTAWIGRLG